MVTDGEKIKGLLENNPRITLAEIATDLNTSSRNVRKRLKRIVYVLRCELWLSHKLTEQNFVQRFSTCSALWKRNENYTYLKNLRLEMKYGLCNMFDTL